MLVLVHSKGHILARARQAVAQKLVTRLHQVKANEGRLDAQMITWRKYPPAQNCDEFCRAGRLWSLLHPSHSECSAQLISSCQSWQSTHIKDSSQRGLQKSGCFPADILVLV